MKKYICPNCWFVEKSNLLKDWTCDMCWEKVLKIWGEYAKVIDNLQINHKTQKALREDKEELLKTATSELRFKNMKVEAYENLVIEIQVLLKQWVNTNLIKKVIENWKERIMLDDLIHYDLVSKNI